MRQKRHQDGGHGFGFRWARSVSASTECEVGNVAAVRALVELGANVDAKDRKGARPVDVARACHAGTKAEEQLVASLERADDA